MKHSTKAKEYYILFLFQPFLALILALKNFRVSGVKNLIWLFTIFFSLTIAIGKESEGSDIVRYIGQMQRFYSMNIGFDDFWTLFQESGEIDILRTLLAFLVSRVTDNQYVLLVVYGTIFGFFFSRNMHYVLSRLEGKQSFIVVLLLISLFLVTPIWTLGGFRFNTAVHVFIFGLLPYLFEKKKKYLFICYLTPVIFHFSFFAPLMVLTAYLILGNRLNLYFMFFLGSLFLSEINITVFNEYIEKYAPQKVAERSESYRTEEKVAQFRDDSAPTTKVWYARYYIKALQWSIWGYLILIFYKYRNVIRKREEWLRLFSFTLFFMGFANVMSSVPSGGRFMAPGSILALTLIILFLNQFKSNLLPLRLIKATIPLLLLFIMIAIRDGLYLTSVTAITANPIIALFTTDFNYSLNDVLKSVF